MPNLFNAPTFKLSDRRAILIRTLEALMADSACRWSFKGTWREPTLEERDNWNARESVAALIREFPSLPINVSSEAVSAEQ
jgi:hypothetical protein